jgi:hypothetical protein
MALAECFKHSANVVILVVSAAARRMRVREKRDDDEYDTWVHSNLTHEEFGFRESIGFPLLLGSFSIFC